MTQTGLHRNSFIFTMIIIADVKYQCLKRSIWTFSTNKIRKKKLINQTHRFFHIHDLNSMQCKCPLEGQAALKGMSG